MVNIRRKLTIWLGMILLLAACAQAATPPVTPATSSEPATLPATVPFVTVDAPPVSASPGPDTPVTSPAGNKPDQNGDYAPQPGDKLLERGEVFIEEADILTLESYPPQFRLHLAGNLPTPCHELRAVVSEPDENNRINVEVYSLVDPGQICIQVLSPFEVFLPLGSYTQGNYSVTLNGQQVIGEISP